MPDALLGEQRVEPQRARQGAARALVLPHPLPADQQQADLAAQPVQVLAVHVRHVVHGVVEVERLAALAPPEVRHVVDTAQAQRERKDLCPAEREVGGVEGPEAAAPDHEVLRTGRVGVDRGDDVVEHEVLEPLVGPRPLLQRQVVVAPARRVVAVDAVDLDAAGVDQPTDRIEQPVALEVDRAPLVGREPQQRSPVVPVHEQVGLAGRQ